MNAGIIDAKTLTFTETYNTYYPILYNIIAAKISDDGTTQDICQDIFMRFYQKFDEINNHRTWLYGTMRNVLLEFYKKKKETAVDISEIFENVSMSFVNGFRDSRIIIEEALENIEYYEDERGRAIFDMIALYNYTFVEAGKELGLSERQVRYRYNIITERIMEYLSTKGIHGLEELL